HVVVEHDNMDVLHWLTTIIMTCELVLDFLDSEGGDHNSGGVPSATLAHWTLVEDVVIRGVLCWIVAQGDELVPNGRRPGVTVVLTSVLGDQAQFPTHINHRLCPPCLAPTEPGYRVYWCHFTSLVNAFYTLYMYNATRTHRLLSFVAGGGVDV